MNQSLPVDLERFVVTMCDDIATPVSRQVKQLALEGRWDDLAAMRVDPLAYDEAEVYFRDAAAVSLLRKCADLPTTVDRKAVAEGKFWESEKQCKRTNERLSTHFLDNPLDWDTSRIGESDGACARLIAEARKEVKRILGRAPSLLKGKFGPGATYGDRGLYTTVPDKMSSRPTFTSGALWHLVPFTGTMWAQACAELGRKPECVRGNRFTTVPKDCTTDRGIAVEPSVNIFYQLAVGQHMKRALLQRGHIDLKRGKEIHMQVACEASKHGCYATLDLSNASDTVSSSLVKLLLPHDWWELLSSLRSPFTLVRGNWVRLEKFSSMGNGYTFELETCIFLCIVLAVRNLRALRQPWESSFEPGRDVWVYGDDIIIPTSWYEDVVSALSYLGFSINKRKSFNSGSFRESCGGDFFDGKAVRPHFIEEFPNEPQQWIAIANGVRRMAVSDSWTLSDRRYLLRSWFVALDVLPSDIRRLRGPEALGDLVIQDEPSRWQQRRRGNLDYIRVYRPARFRRVGWKYFDSTVVLAAACYGAGDGRTGVTPRDAVLGYKVGWVPVPASRATSTYLPYPCRPPK